MNDGNLKQFEKGYDPRRDGNGRKPKVYTILREMGYGNDDIIACFRELMWYNIKEIKELVGKSNIPIIKGIMAKSLITDYNKGNLNNTREFLLRLMGAPTQKTESTVTNTNPTFIVKDEKHKEEIEKRKDF